jgi:hypothetical protein
MKVNVRKNLVTEEYTYDKMSKDVHNKRNSQHRVIKVSGPQQSQGQHATHIYTSFWRKMSTLT